MAGFFTVSIVLFSSCGPAAADTATEIEDAAEEMVDDAADVANDMVEEVVEPVGDMTEDTEGMDSLDADVDLDEGSAEAIVADSSKTEMETK